MRTPRPKECNVGHMVLDLPVWVGKLSSIPGQFKNVFPHTVAAKPAQHRGPVGAHLSLVLVGTGAREEDFLKRRGNHLKTCRAKSAEPERMQGGHRRASGPCCSAWSLIPGLIYCTITQCVSLSGSPLSARFTSASWFKLPIWFTMFDMRIWLLKLIAGSVK